MIIKIITAPFLCSFVLFKRNDGLKEDDYKPFNFLRVVSKSDDTPLRPETLIIVINTFLKC